LPSPKAAQAVSIAAGTNIKNCADDFFITSFSTREANIQTGTKGAGFTEQAKYSAYSHWPDVNFELSLKTISAVAARFKGRWLMEKYGRKYRFWTFLKGMNSTGPMVGLDWRFITRYLNTRGYHPAHHREYAQTA